MTLRTIGTVTGTGLAVTYDDETTEVLLSDDNSPEESPYRFTTAEFFAFMSESRRLAAILARIIRSPTTAAISPADEAARGNALAVLRSQLANGANLAARGGRR